ncbi:MAG: hypothetical protein V4579_05855 [Pseudomonadota bacterium]
MPPRLRQLSCTVRVQTGYDLFIVLAATSVFIPLSGVAEAAAAPAMSDEDVPIDPADADGFVIVLADADGSVIVPAVEPAEALGLPGVAEPVAPAAELVLAPDEGAAPARCEAIWFSIEVQVVVRCSGVIA